MDPTPSTLPLPDRLSILGLAYPLLLHPGLVLSVTLSQAECLALLRNALGDRKKLDGKDGHASHESKQAPILLLCVPYQDGQPKARSQEQALDGLAHWGCVARVLRMVRSAESDQCTLLLSGLVRAEVGEIITRVDTMGIASPYARITPHYDPSPSDPSLSQLPAAKAMQSTAYELIALLGKVDPSANAPSASIIAHVPMLPPLMLKRVGALMEDMEKVQVSLLADLLVGVFGGACVWEDRLVHLQATDVAHRIDHTAAMLERALERVRILREMLVQIPYALQNQNRVALARAQLGTITAQLASTMPSVRLLSADKKDGQTERRITLRPSAGGRPASVRRIMQEDGALPDDAREDEGDEVDAIAQRLETVPFTPEARKVCQQELRRLRRMPPQGTERGVLMNYLETMCDLPWERTTAQTDAADLQGLIPASAAGDLSNEALVPRARLVLEADHFGLDKVKKRILEYLAVLELKQAQAREGVPDEALASIQVQYKGPILLLVGPPGTGKTSIARSLAAALHRPFARVSLGGVRDEAEIRGHRRTYVGALPGAIVSALRRAKTNDCVMLLDEVDKLSSGNGVHGDPTAALLEVLDPEQNHTFKDHYINVPVDLSHVLFIATANTLDTISEPLLDRTDVVSIPGYTFDEKVAIARRHILPKQIEAQGLRPAQFQADDSVLMAIATRYTREAGVRSMERRIGDVVRAKAVEYAESLAEGAKTSYDPVVRVDDLERILGIDTYDPEVVDTEGIPGVSTGLAYQGSGNGGILHIETAFMPPGAGELHLTGSLGDVIRESAELAFSWVKSHAFALGITTDRTSAFPKNDVHLHMPSGATPKDGPSAGVAITSALVSLYLGIALDPHLAMTGEITLRGLVTPVGGIKEKVLGAHRAGIAKVILPVRNRKDYEQDLPEAVRREMQVVFVHTIHEALDAAFGKNLEAQISTRYGDSEGQRRLQELHCVSRL